jgi:hypothetical protein
MSNVAIALSAVSIIISAWTIFYSLGTIRRSRGSIARSEATIQECKRIREAYEHDGRTCDRATCQYTNLHAHEML